VRVVLDGSSAVADGGADTAARDGAADFQPAGHPRLPQMANLGGPVLASPKVQPILYASDAAGADIQSFLSELARASYWPSTTAEYGVGLLKVLSPIKIPTQPPASLSDDSIQSDLARNTAGPSPVWGAADPATVYLLILPQGTLATFSNGATCCGDFGGYHFETQARALTVPYAVACACPGALGLDLTALQERTIAISHELVEAATDPFPNSNPAFVGEDYADFVWTLVTGGEAGDLCAFNADAVYTLPGTTFAAQRSWSNAAAANAQNPCVPAAGAGPYFNSFPALGPITFGSGTSSFRTQGVVIPLGQSMTIDVDLFSAAPTAKKWRVSAYAYEDLLGGNKSNLALSLDGTEGWNGDRLRLTLTPRQANPNLGGEAFVLISQYGAPGDPDFQTNLSMGLVGN